MKPRIVKVYQNTKHTEGIHDDSINSNTQERTFAHLTENERGLIAAYIDQRLSLREIGWRMGRDVGTISRERKRGIVQQIDTFREPYTKYFRGRGARVYEENRENCGAHSTVMTAWSLIVFLDTGNSIQLWVTNQ